MTEKQTTNLNDLKQIIPFSWKKISTRWDNYNTRTELIFTPYLEVKDIVPLLDSVLGCDNWKDRYFEVNGSVYCEVSVYSEKHQTFITRSDAGETKRDYVKDLYTRLFLKEYDDQRANPTDKRFKYKKDKSDGEYEELPTAKKLKIFLDNSSKTEATSSFKRACAKFGVGSFLHSFEDFIIYEKDVENREGKKVKSYVNDKNEVIASVWDKTFNINDYILENMFIPENIIDSINNCKNATELKQNWNKLSVLKANTFLITIKNSVYKSFPKEVKVKESEILPETKIEVETKIEPFTIKNAKDVKVIK